MCLLPSHHRGLLSQNCHNSSSNSSSTHNRLRPALCAGPIPCLSRQQTSRHTALYATAVRQQEFLPQQMQVGLHSHVCLAEACILPARTHGPHSCCCCCQQRYPHRCPAFCSSSSSETAPAAAAAPTHRISNSHSPQRSRSTSRSSMAPSLVNTLPC